MVGPTAESCDVSSLGSSSGSNDLMHGDAGISRRQAIGRGAVALGGLAAGGLLDPGLVSALVGSGPRPIPGGFDQHLKPVPKDPFVHVLPPGIGFEMSTISDFKGIVAGSEIRGRARGSDGSQWDFDTDMRFFSGSYVALDGRLRRGAFGFI
jgi:hypothetical protein